MKINILWRDIQIQSQRGFLEKGCSALKNSCSVNLPVSSVVKILENYLRRTPFHLRRYFQGFWLKCLEQLYGVGWIQRFTSISAYLVQMQENTNQKKLLIWTLLLRFTSKSAYSVQIQENTDQKKFRIWTLFTQCSVWQVPKSALTVAAVTLTWHYEASYETKMRNERIPFWKNTF